MCCVDSPPAAANTNRDKHTHMHAHTHAHTHNYKEESGQRPRGPAGKLLLDINLCLSWPLNYTRCMTHANVSHCPRQFIDFPASRQQLVSFSRRDFKVAACAKLACRVPTQPRPGTRLTSPSCLTSETSVVRQPQPLSRQHDSI